MKMILNSRVIVVFLVFLLFSCGEVDDRKLVTTAKKYIENNLLREANLELKNALQVNPKNAEARYLLGQVNIKVGDMASSAKEFRKAQEAGWDEAQSQVGLMEALVYMRDFEKVLDTIKIKKDYSTKVRADLYGLKAFAEAASGYAGLAKESIQQGVALDKDSFHVLKTSVQLNIVNGKLDVAERQVKHALSIYKDNVEFLLLSTYLAMKNKDGVAARKQFQKIIALEPENLVTFNGRKARIGLAHLEIIDKNFEQAKNLLVPLFRQRANDPEVNYIGSLLSFKRADYDLAEERLLKVLKVAPGHAPSLLLFGSVNFAQKDYEQAAYYVSKYLQLDSENVHARKLLGRAYMLLGRHKEAESVLRPGLQGRDDDAELLALVGLSQLQGGNIASGINDLKKAVTAAPESNVLRKELAKAYISAGETEKAIKALNILLAESGDKKQTEALLVAAHIKAEQYDQAIDVVLDMLQKTPDDPVVLSLVGNVFVASNDRVEARKYFNKALQVKPDYVPATMLLARLEEVDGFPEKAEALYRQLVKINTKEIGPLIELARLAGAQRRTEEMLEWLELARKRSPHEIRPLKILIEYYLSEKQFDEAARLIGEAMVIEPRNKALLLLQARLQMAEGQNNKALSSLNALVIKMPDSIYVRTMLAEVYFNLQQSASARRQLDIVLEKQPYNSSALVLMASLELRSANYDRALKYASRIQKAWPDLYIGYEIAGDAFVAKKNYAGAKNSYEKALKLKPMAELVIKLSEASVRSGDFEVAAGLLRAWLSDHPDDPRALQFLATTYQRMKRDDKAIEIFEKVLTIQPDNVVALNNLAWLYSQANNPKSLGLAEKAYHLSPNDSGVQDTYGWVLVQQGQVDKGRRILEQVMKDLPGVPEVRYHYAIALMKSGEKVKARKILINLIEDGKSFEGREQAERLMK